LTTSSLWFAHPAPDRSNSLATVTPVSFVYINRSLARAHRCQVTQEPDLT
jgi:hypothetical protein